VKLTIEEIGKISKLARLELTDNEKKKYAEELSVVLDYIEMLNEVDTDNITETCQVTGLKNVVREDKILACEEETKEKIIAQFPVSKNNLLQVKEIFS